MEFILVSIILLKKKKLAFFFFYFPFEPAHKTWTLWLSDLWFFKCACTVSYFLGYRHVFHTISFLNASTAFLRLAKALAILRLCTDSLEPLLVALLTINLAINSHVLAHFCQASYKRGIIKQYRPRSNAADRGVLSGSARFVLYARFSIKHGNNKD